MNLQKERLTKDVRYQDSNEVALDRCCENTLIKGYFIFISVFVDRPKGRFLLYQTTFRLRL